MRLILSLPVLVVALLMLLEGPAPSEAAPSVPEKLKEFGSTVKDKVLEAIKHIEQSKFPEKTWSLLSEAFTIAKDKIKTTFS